jgi:hypothetical protein
MEKGEMTKQEPNTGGKELGPELPLSADIAGLIYLDLA